MGDPPAYFCNYGQPLNNCKEELIMREVKTQVEAPAPAKKVYVKPSVTKHAAASQIVGSCPAGYTGVYYV
jgi:hypothetical protein